MTDAPPTSTPASSPSSLDERINAALDALVRALTFEPLGGDRFRAPCEGPRFERIFGGQLLAQALAAANATVAGQAPDSLHAYFTGGGTVEQPVEIAVERVRDGRSLSVRRVEVSQAGRSLLTAIASFHANPPAPTLAVPAPGGPAPDEVPALQDWVPAVPAFLESSAQMWVATPPAIELRIAEPPTFLGGASADGIRSHWIRLPRNVADPAMHASLLAYASDYLLLDMAFRSHPIGRGSSALIGLSLDHAIWFHRAVDFSRWHQYTQETLAINGERGLVRGSIHDDAGHLVATATQEVLVRERP